MTLLGLSAVGVTFGTTPVLRDVTLTLNPGDRLAVLGPSGSGKSTLLRTIAGLEGPTHGTISLAGRRASEPGRVLLAPERRSIALVFQGLALFPHLRALDQIAFAARGRGGVDRARHLLDRIGLAHRATARLDQLSGGERQRIALARALAQAPRLILMDEPFASLDDDRRGEMRDLLRSLLAGSTAALVLVTHSRDDALDLADRAMVLDRGRPVAHGPLADVLAHPRHAAAARVLGLGQLVAGVVVTPGQADTPLGPIATDATAGRVTLLVRPDQLQLAADGVPGDVVGIELRPPLVRDVRRVAVIRVGPVTVRVPLGGRAVAVGDRVGVRVEGACGSVLDD